MHNCITIIIIVITITIIITTIITIIIAGPNSKNKSRGVCAGWEGRSQLYLNMLQSLSLDMIPIYILDIEY